MEQKDYRLAAIMYTDIAGFSRMMEKDEAGTLKLLHMHNTLVTELATKRHGTVIKTIGDAFLVDFRNTVEALQCAMDIQAALYEINKGGEGQPLLLRIGLHLGDIYFFENDALGEGINIAARLQSFARPGCICFSQDVYNQVLNKIDFRADKLGKVSLKNITKEIHAYEIVSPNTEFDPNRDKPRPGYKPDADAPAAEAGAAAPPIVVTPAAGARIAADVAAPDPGSSTPLAVPPVKAAPPLPAAATPADRGYDPEAAKAVLDDIRKAILADTKAMGRRLTVAEAKARYGDYGVEAHEVIASMLERGLIVKNLPGSPAGAGASAQSDLPSEIGRAVEGIARAIGQGVDEWQRSSRNADRGRYGYDRHRDREERRAERVARDIEHAVSGIEKAVGDKVALKMELKRHELELGTGKWDKELKDSEHWKPGTEDLETDFSRYRDRIEEKARKSQAGFVGGLITYLGVNALLWYINLKVAQGFMWAPIVSAAWGTGVVSSFFAMLRGRAKAAEIDKMPDLAPEPLATYKKINRVKDGLASHFASVLAVPPMLFIINRITTPDFMWAFIPAGIMALSFVAHLAAYPGTLHGLEKRLLRSLGVDSWRELFRLGRTRKAGAAAGKYASVYAEAAAVRDEIVRELKRNKGSGEFGKDMIPTLDEYVEQVKLLSQSVNEIDGIISTIPLDALRADREALQAKRGGTESPQLKEEYGRSIAEIERQEKACRDLESQREVLGLRLGSSVNALKQLKIDMARMKALPDSGGSQAIEDLRKKAGELSGYLDDLKAGYEESQEDPFAELERLAAEADARKKLGDGGSAS